MSAAPGGSSCDSPPKKPGSNWYVTAPPAELGELCASQMLGLGLARYVIAFEPLASADGARVVAWAGPTLQRYLTGDLG